VENYPEPPPLPGVKDTPFSKPTHVLQVDVSSMPLDQLLELRNRIEQHLPAKDLSDMDLKRELVLQVLALQQLQASVISDDDVAPNQKSQVANSLSSALSTLVKIQGDVNTSERFKKLEAALVGSISLLPLEAQRAFIEEYEKIMESV
jgi:hypothetical protein